MKTLLISDIHNRITWIEKAIKAEKPDLTIFLGDYFDYFHDTPKDAKFTATWLRESLENDDRVHLYGNHDMPYAFNNNPYLDCPGFTREKWSAVAKIMRRDDWDKIKLHIFHQDHLISHAGVNPYMAHPVHGLTVEMVDENCQKALQSAQDCLWSPYTAQGYRMTDRWRGGITWQDWDHEFLPVPNLNQIVGHSIFDTPKTLHEPTSKNYCIDCNSRFLTFIEDGKVTHVKNKYLSKPVSHLNHL